MQSVRCVSRVVAATDTEARRYWRRFQRLMQMPEKDRKADIRMLDTMTKAHAAAG